MAIKNHIIIILLSFLVAHSVQATTWTTIGSGSWNSPFVWATGIVPPYISSDTFIIKHPVFFENNLVLNQGAYLLIDSAGGLCAHRYVTVNSGAVIEKYGIFEADSLFISGGVVICYPPEDIVLWRYADISNGGSISSNGCQFVVGPWFDCRSPQYNFLDVTENDNPKTINIFPNPTHDKLYINSKTDKWSLAEIIDFTGRAVLSLTLNNDQMI